MNWSIDMPTFNFCIKIGVPTKSQMEKWGDYYLAKSLSDELVRQGHNSHIQILPQWDTDEDMNDDIIIHLRGLSTYRVKPRHFNIMWNISHPESISKEEYEKYDLVLVSSVMYAEKLKKDILVPVESFLQFTDLLLFYFKNNHRYKHPLIFVGNSRGVCRQIVQDAINCSNELKVIGSNWKRLIPRAHILEEWHANDKLNEVYSSCRILLNDHWEDMRKYGFINNRFFDAIACKAIVVNDDHLEIKKMFPMALTYSGVDQLKELLGDISANESKYRGISEHLYKKVIEEHTVVQRVQQLLMIVSRYNVEDFVENRRSFSNTKIISVKSKVRDYILGRFGFGKIYKIMRKVYIIGKNSNSIFRKVIEKIKRKNQRGNQELLLNVTSEAEIKSLAQNVAKPINYDDQNELVSIIVPTRNGKKYIEQLLPNLRKNTLYKNCELIIVDNNSSDRTLEYVESWKDRVKLHYYNTYKSLNFSQSINYGVSKSNGKYLVFLNNDVVPLYGWLDEMLTCMKNNNAGIVGARLVYPRLSPARLRIKEVIYPGCSIQHDGIKFKWTKAGVIPFNTGKYVSPMIVDYSSDAKPVPAVTAACMLTDRQTFDQIGGFDEKYWFGREDVDYCLKVHELGKDVLVANKSILFHREFSSQIKQMQSRVKALRKNNQDLFVSRWNEKLASAIWNEKLSSSNNFWSDKPLHITFLVTENEITTTAGDYFSAYGLGEALQKLYGYQITYLARRPENEWSDIPTSSDIIISMLHDCNIRDLKLPEGSITIAWIRGFLSDWKKARWLTEFDGIISSSVYAQSYLAEIIPKSKQWGIVPLAVNSYIFKDTSEVKRNIDVSFVGNLFHVPRDIVKNLEISEGMDFRFYGRLETGEPNHPWKKYHHGTLPYLSLPDLYRQSKIVIEDIAPFNYGTINLRVYEAMASGALVIANNAPELKETFGDKVIIYRDKNELNSLIKYFLMHEYERKQIVLKAKELVHHEHTFLTRANQFVSILERNLVLISPKEEQSKV